MSLLTPNHQGPSQWVSISKKKILFLFLLMIVLVCIDHGTKIFFHENTIFSTKEFTYQPPSVEVSSLYGTLETIPTSPSTDPTTKIFLKSNQTVSQKYFSPEREFFYVKQTVVVSDFWSFDYIRNHDIGFSLLRGLDSFVHPEMKIKLLIGIQFLALMFILVYFIFILKMKYSYPFVFILSGGIGNAGERIFRGYVVDFIKWEFPYLPVEFLNPWPIFNVADVWVCVGGGLLLIFLLIENKISKKLNNNGFYGQDNLPIYLR